ncbi:MAG: hypothetical protein AMXMBFR23_17570 [Chloroflexota bacterium]
MDGELVFSVVGGEAHRARRISLAEAGLRERDHLQEWIRGNPEILGPDVRIVTFEFAGWQSRSGSEFDRLDLLGIDTDGRLIVAELKRGIAPDTVEMQAVKYAAFASRFSPDTLAASHAAYLTKVEGVLVSKDDALVRLQQHVGGELDIEQLRRPRIVLVAAGFPPQVSAAAVWLGEMGVEVTLVEFGAYRTESEVVLTVSQLWPLPDVEDFTISPRQAEVRAAEERTVRNREARAVTTLLDEGLIEDGTHLRMSTAPVRSRLREAIERWIAEEPSRGGATWRTDSRTPLIWSLDGTAWSPTGLAKEIVTRATGEQFPVIPGPRCWVLNDGRSLSELAGFGRPAGRDWSDLHRLVASIRPGEWTTYGDLAEVVGSAARSVGQHVTSCAACANAYRVLTVDGTVADQFRWRDETDERTPREVLEAEGIEFVAGRASQHGRLDAHALRRRLNETK